MSPGISEDPFALTQRVERRGPSLFLDTPRSHRPKRQRNHQRCLNASSRSVTLQRELLVIECVALQHYAREDQAILEHVEDRLVRECLADIQEVPPCEAPG